MGIRLSLFVLVVCLCAAPCASALKQPLGPEFNISNPSTTTAGGAAVAADSDTGRYFVVWTKNHEPDPGVLSGRLIDRDGRALTEEIPIAEHLWFISYLSPVVAYNAALREYLVVWTWFASDPYRQEIRAQRINAAGEKIGGVITMEAGNSSDQPSVACSSRSGACLVAWSARPVLGASTNGARARLIAAGAQTAGPEVTLDARITAGSTAVGYAPEPDRYLVAWGGNGVSGRMLDSTGSPMGGGLFEIAQLGTGPVLAYNQADREFGVLFGGGSGIAGATVGQDGNVGPAGTVSRGRIDGASLAFDSRDRSYLAAWGRADETHGVGAFLSPNLAPIAPAEFAGGYQVTYNPAADEYLLVKASCSLPGLLVSVCGRRVGVPPGGSSDRRRPILRLTVRRLQHIVRQRGLMVRATCDEACRLRASAGIVLPGAKRTLTLRPAEKALSRGASKRLKLRATNSMLRKLRRALRRRSRLRVRLTATATDPSGNRTVAKRKLRARR